MLNSLSHFVLPGAEQMVHHDDQDQGLFHMVPELPSRLGRSDGSPAFSRDLLRQDYTLVQALSEAARLALAGYGRSR